MIELAVAVAGGALLLLALWGRPRLALVLWVLSFTMIPPWISVHLIVRMPLPFIIALVALAATIFYPGLRGSIRVTKYDVYFGVFLTICLGVLVTGDSDVHAPVVILVNWVAPYVAARVLTAAAGTGFTVNLIALVFGIVGGLAVVELALDWHPFTEWNVGSLQVYELWRPIQTRLGRPRSEWAFGHSIALGGSLALSVPFIARSTYGDFVKLGLFAMVAGGVFAAGSRGATVAFILTAGICVLNAQRLRDVRAISFVCVTAAITVILSFMLPAFDTWLIGSSRGDRASALYRGEIYEDFLPRISWLAPYDVYAPGENADKSIDSAVLDIGLRLGWVVLILAAFPLLMAAVRALAGTATVGEIALVGQVPVLATAALIAQYESWIFIVGGVAVTVLTRPTRAEAAESGQGIRSQGTILAVSSVKSQDRRGAFVD